MRPDKEVDPIPDIELERVGSRVFPEERPRRPSGGNAWVWVVIGAGALLFGGAGVFFTQQMQAQQEAQRQDAAVLEGIGRFADISTDDADDARFEEAMG